MSNPYQPFFDKLDRTVLSLEGVREDSDVMDAVDILKRAGYVLANMLNVQATVYPVIILEDEPEVVPGVAEDTAAPPVEQPESLAP